MPVPVNFSRLPSDVALLLARGADTRTLTEELGRALDLDRDDLGALGDCIVGAVAEAIDYFLPKAKKR